MVCGPTAFLALCLPFFAFYLRELAPVLGAKPAAGAGVLSEVTEHEGSPGLTVASPKALLGNRVHWTHLSSSKFFRGPCQELLSTLGSVLSLFLRSA